jgi:transcriptional regulator with XRE-family HTH domain
MAREELWLGDGALFRTLAGWPTRGHCGAGCLRSTCGSGRRQRARAVTSFSKWDRDACRARVGEEEAARRPGAIMAGQWGYQLAEQRKRLGFTQAGLAEIMGVTLGRVSQIEQGEVSTVEALASYIAALGGKLELVADIGAHPLKMPANQPPDTASDDDRRLAWCEASDQSVPLSAACRSSWGSGPAHGRHLADLDGVAIGPVRRRCSRTRGGCALRDASRNRAACGPREGVPGPGVEPGSKRIKLAGRE